jgi:hypothetical protein
MKRLVSFVVRLVGITLVVLTSFAHAQVMPGSSNASYGEFHGTWFHSAFIDVLHKTSSIEQAIAAKSEREPLYIAIDSTDPSGNLRVGISIGREERGLILRTVVPNVGMKWAIGTEDAPVWMVASDTRQNSYIALTELDSIEKKPIVLGKLPSKNSDPTFILMRMINTSVVSGRWVDPRGKAVEFTPTMIATIDGQTFPYELRVDPSTLRLTLSSTQGKPRNYVVNRIDGMLTLTPLGQKGTPRPLVLRAAQKSR